MGRASALHTGKKRTGSNLRKDRVKQGADISTIWGFFIALLSNGGEVLCADMFKGRGLEVGGVKWRT